MQRTMRPLACRTPPVPAALGFALLLALCGCGPRPPSAPHRFPIDGGAWPVELCSDRLIGDWERRLAAHAGASRATIEQWTGRRVQRPVDVLIVDRAAFDDFARSHARHNSGALLLDEGDRCSIILARPPDSMSAEGRAMLFDLARFHLGHELLHAACPERRRRGADIEEGLANFLAVRAMGSDGGGALAAGGGSASVADGLLRTAIGTTLVSRTLDGDAITLSKAVGSRGPPAYALGWLAFEFASACFDRAAFRRWSEWCLGTGSLLGGLGADGEFAGLQASGAPRDHDGFAAFVDAKARELDLWCAPMGLHAVGSRGDGTMVLADDECQFAMVLAESAAPVVPPSRRAKHAAAPTILASRGVVVSVPGVEFDWAALTIGSQQGLRIRAPATTAGIASSGASGAVLHACGRAARGDSLRIEASGDDLVVRGADGAEVGRLTGAAAKIFAISIELHAGAGPRPVAELRRTH